MIPKEVTDSVSSLEQYHIKYLDGGQLQNLKTIKNFLYTSDKYIKDLEQHVDDLASSTRGMEDIY